MIQKNYPDHLVELLAEIPHKSYAQLDLQNLPFISEDEELPITKEALKKCFPFWQNSLLSNMIKACHNINFQGMKLADEPQDP